MNVNVRRDHNLAFLQVEEPGANLRELIQLRLRELCLRGVDCVYVDLPRSISHASTSLVCKERRDRERLEALDETPRVASSRPRE
jgi:hypothetical protein